MARPLRRRELAEERAALPAERAGLGRLAEKRRQQAMAHAAVIQSHWRSRGYPLAKAEAYPLDKDEMQWGVRSNLNGGLPPKEAA
jgi:hypothetical protein